MNKVIKSFSFILVLLTLLCAINVQARGIEEYPRNSYTDEVFHSAATMPKFPGEPGALKRFLTENIQYPQSALNNHTEGKVVIQLIVEKDGSVGEVKIARSADDPDLDREAVRVCKTLPKFSPGLDANGDPVRVWYTFYVPFRLPEDVMSEYVDQLQEDALQGDAHSQYLLGSLYFKGDRVPQDYARAAQLFEKAALQGHGEAKGYLPISFALAKDYDNALKWYETINGPAQDFNTATMLYSLAQENPNHQIDFLTDAANMGNALAMHDLSFIYAIGMSLRIDCDENKAVDFYNQYLKATGVSTQEATIADVYYHIYSDTITDILPSYYYNYLKDEYLEKAAALGHNEAQVLMGNYYYNYNNLEKAASYYEAAAMEGNAEALYGLGLIYASTGYESQDYTKAAQLFEEAAQLGEPEAQYYLGYLYLNGLGVEQNAQKATEWFTKAAQQGNERAITELSKHYVMGYGKQYLELYRNAAEAGNINAQINLGNCYYYGDGVKQDYNQAIAWYQKAFENEDYIYNDLKQIAFYNLLGTYIHIKDYDNAELWYAKHFYTSDSDFDTCYILRNAARIIYPEKKYLDFLNDAATLGDMEALSVMSCFYAIGKDVKRDDKKAVEFYKLYKQKHLEEYHYYDNEDYSNKKFTIADVYLHISDISFNEMVSSQYEGDSQQWCIKAAEMGNVDAQKSLANEFYDNEDYEQAFRWCSMAAKQKDENALFFMGYLYDNGQGTAQDHKAAVEWYMKAAQQGNEQAQNIIGECYYNGDVLPQDYKKAVQWFQKAAIKVGDATLNLATCYYEGKGVEKNYCQAAQLFSSYINNYNRQMPITEYGYLSPYKFFELPTISNMNYNERTAEELAQMKQDADDGDGYSQYDLGMYYLGNGNTQEAITLLSNAASQNILGAPNQLISIYINAGDYDNALYWLKKVNTNLDENFGVGDMLYSMACNNYPNIDYVSMLQQAAAMGEKNAIATMACLYAMGDEVERSDDRAVELYRQYLEKINKPNPNVTIADVYNLIAKSYSFNSIIFEKIRDNQQQWMEKSAQAGCVDAQFELASHHDYDGDMEQAAFWYLKAAEQGHAQAQMRIAECYKNGMGVNQDYKLAQHWLEKAASQNLAEAQYMLGDFFTQGFAGTKNTELANDWYYKAATIYKAQIEEHMHNQE